MPELVGEGVGADDGFVGLHGDARDGRDQTRGLGDRLGLDAGGEGHPVLARAQAHHDLFHRRVAGTLAESVDGAFDLPRPGLHRGQGIGDREAEIVMAMDRQDGEIDVGNAVDQHLDQRSILVGNGVADRVGDVDRARAGLDRRFDRAAEEIMIGARSVLGRPFHVVDEAPRIGDAFDHRLQHLLRRFLELVLHVQRRGRNEGMDAAIGGGAQRLDAAVDVGPRGAGQPGHLGDLERFGDRLDRLEVAVRGDREASLDDVDAHLLEHGRDAQFLLEIHRAARRLFAVAQGGVEDDHALVGGGGSHVDGSFLISAASCR